MATVNVTDENFEAEVLKAGKPVLLDLVPMVYKGQPMIVSMPVAARILLK